MFDIIESLNIIFLSLFPMKFFGAIFQASKTKKAAVSCSGLSTVML